jgi:predicted glycoside hydrolase/deacetylase ChbG (UPF0249 family)
MKQLIVNADDLGADEARNTGIFEAIEAGVVTSVSILPNGPALKDALGRICSLGLNSISIGLHFNLSEGRPLAEGLKLLTGPDGCFRGKAWSQKMFVKQGEPGLEDEIRREFEAQIATLRNSGVRLDHLDGHQHVHILPAAAAIVANKAKAHGIQWIRIPEEPADELQPAFQAESDRVEARFFSGHAAKARPLYQPSGFRAADHFRGLFFKGKLPANFWSEFLETIPDGLTELMVHPGRAAQSTSTGPFSRFSTLDREKELTALTDGRFRLALLKTGVELTPFPPSSVSLCEF